MDKSEFLTDLSPYIHPLPEEIQDGIIHLQYRWSDGLDMRAEPWTM